MLSTYFVSATRVDTLRAGLAGPLVESFAQGLARVQYAQITARRHLRAAEHLVCWADRHDIALTRLGEPQLAQFARHLPRCRCLQYGRSNRMLVHGARLFLSHLERTGVIPAAAAGDRTSEPALVRGFDQWMHDQRGTGELTLSMYRPHIRELLARLGQEPQTLDARSIRALVLEGSQRYGWSVARKRTTALRIFLLFLIAQGLCASGLEAAVPVLAHWRLASVPRYPQPADVERLIDSRDPTTAVGRRDRAIQLLLARLGLRAGDIVQLRLPPIPRAFPRPRQAKAPSPAGCEVPRSRPI